MSRDVLSLLAIVGDQPGDRLHADQIQIESFSWGQGRTGAGAAIPKSPGQLTLRYIQIWVSQDKASPTLMLPCAIVSGIQWSGSAHGADAIPIETIRFDFGKVKITYQPKAPEGDAGGSVVQYVTWTLGNGTIFSKPTQESRSPRAQGASESVGYCNAFVRIPSQAHYRPTRLTLTSVSGSASAVIVSPDEGSFTDYGRIRVHFDWDRASEIDSESSCWVRVGSLWAGKQWGTIHIPRIGQEVIVDFLKGDPDRPFIVGSVYNDVSAPKFQQPQVQTGGLLSRASPSPTLLLPSGDTCPWQ
jgi:type VI protein secretion system component Hcp